MQAYSAAALSTAYELLYGMLARGWMPDSCHAFGVELLALGLAQWVDTWRMNLPHMVAARTRFQVASHLVM